MNGGRHNLVLDKNEAFALRIVKMCRYLCDQGERVMAKPVLRSGTSIGANITEGHYAASTPDFINKYAIAEKEAAETLYWLHLLIKADYLANDVATKSLVTDCDEINPTPRIQYQDGAKNGELWMKEF